MMGKFFSFGKKGGGEAEGGLSKGHNFSGFFLEPFPYADKLFITGQENLLKKATS